METKQEQTPDPSRPVDETVVIDCGGRLFRTCRSTFDRYPYALMPKLLASPMAVRLADGAYFIDRDPDEFACVLELYRTGRWTPGPARKINETETFRFYMLPAEPMENSLRASLRTRPLHIDSIIQLVPFVKNSGSFHVLPNGSYVPAARCAASTCLIFGIVANLMITGDEFMSTCANRSLEYLGDPPQPHYNAHDFFDPSIVLTKPQNARLRLNVVRYRHALTVGEAWTKPAWSNVWLRCGWSIMLDVGSRM